jgi:hypothetical protein
MVAWVERSEPHQLSLKTGSLLPDGHQRLAV